MEGKIELEIVTPKGRALLVSCDEVTAPSVAGEFGVMPGHLPLLAAVRTGLVAYRLGTDQKRCAVSTGFAEAGSNRLLILTEDYIEREGIDPVLVRKELASVQNEIEKMIQSVEARDDVGARKALVERENWLAAQLELYGDPPPATMRPFEEYSIPATAVVEEEEAAGK